MDFCCGAVGTSARVWRELLGACVVGNLIVRAPGTFPAFTSHAQNFPLAEPRRAIAPAVFLQAPNSHLN